MTLTTAQIDLIRDSFQRLQSEAESSAELFYQRLFEIAPELRPMFRSDMTGQGMRFITTLDSASGLMSKNIIGTFERNPCNLISIRESALRAGQSASRD